MIARLKLTSQRAHWIEVTRNGRADETDFHNYLSDLMTTQSAQEMIVLERSAERYLTLKYLIWPISCGGGRLLPPPSPMRNCPNSANAPPYGPQQTRH